MQLIQPSTDRASSRAALTIIQLDSRSRLVGPTTIGCQRAHTPATNVRVTKFEPTMLPIAAAGWRYMEANRDTQNSGSEVMTARHYQWRYLEPGRSMGTRQ